MREYGLHRQADAELFEAAQYYRDREPWLEVEFEEDINRAIEFILAHPEASPIISRRGARRKLLTRFPYSLVYVVKPERILILAVAHQSRRPGYWADRFEGSRIEG